MTMGLAVKAGRVPQDMTVTAAASDDLPKEEYVEVRNKHSLILFSVAKHFICFVLIRTFWIRGMKN